MTLQELLNQIRCKQASFSAAQRLVASYVVENYHMIPFLSISDLANSIGVSNNTVVKFCNRLGFDRFAEFKKFISEYVSQRTTSDLIISQKLSLSSDDSFFARGMEETEHQKELYRRKKTEKKQLAQKRLAQQAAKRKARETR